MSRSAKTAALIRGQTCEELYNGTISGPDYEARISDYIILDKGNAADYQ